LTYEKTVAYIFDIPKFTKKNGPAHTKRLMELLFHPQEQFLVIHVAGSNGKGSVCAFLNNILRNCGYHVGLFTSPHLIDIRERFQIDGHPCSKSQFLLACAKVGEAVTQMEQEGFAHPTFFEYIFAAAMVIFREAGVQYAVVETGLGGRLDATNVIKEPLLTIITSISLEHTKILGNTIEEIAKEKAGIIKPGVPVVIDGSAKEAVRVISREAEKKNSPCHVVNPNNIKILLNNQKMIDFCFRSGYDNTIVKIPFSAAYQAYNAALAFEGIKYLQKQLQIEDEEILKGFLTVQWPGRMEEIQQNIYFDGAHNRAGVEAFLNSVESLSAVPAILLFAIGSEKDYIEVIKLICKSEQWEYIILTSVSGGGGVDEEELLKLFFKEQPGYQLGGRRKDTKILAIDHVKEAYQTAVSKKAAEQNLFCAGSLYLIGELKSLLSGNNL